ncbi:hypothetical protein PR048_008360, partial [Dryococelus australis]
MIGEGDQMMVVGIISTGIGCARPRLPGLYTRISEYMVWIKGHVLRATTNLLGDACNTSRQGSPNLPRARITSPSALLCTCGPLADSFYDVSWRNGHVLAWITLGIQSYYTTDRPDDKFTVNMCTACEMEIYRGRNRGANSRLQVGHSAPEQSNRTGLQAAITLANKSSSNPMGLSYTNAWTNPYSQNSNGVVSGERGGHATGLLFSIQRSGYAAFTWSSIILVERGGAPSCCSLIRCLTASGTSSSQPGIMEIYTGNKHPHNNRGQGTKTREKGQQHNRKRDRVLRTTRTGRFSARNTLRNILDHSRLTITQAKALTTLHEKQMFLPESCTAPPPTSKFKGEIPFCSIDYSFEGEYEELRPELQEWLKSMSTRSGSLQVGIVPDDAASRRVFSGISRFPRPFIRALLHIHLTSPSSGLKTSLLRAAQISSLTFALARIVALCFVAVRVHRWRKHAAFDRGRTVVYCYFGLSYLEIVSRVGRNGTTVERKWVQLVEQGRAERRAGSQRTRRTNERNDRYLVRMANTDRAATPNTLAQEFRRARYCPQAPAAAIVHGTSGLERRTACRRLLRRILRLLAVPRWSRTHVSWQHGVHLAESCILIWGTIRFYTTITLLRFWSLLLSPIFRTSPAPCTHNARPRVAHIVRRFLDEYHVMSHRFLGLRVRPISRPSQSRGPWSDHDSSDTRVYDPRPLNHRTTGNRSSNSCNSSARSCQLATVLVASRAHEGGRHSMATPRRTQWSLGRSLGKSTASRKLLEWPDVDTRPRLSGVLYTGQAYVPFLRSPATTAGFTHTCNIVRLGGWWPGLLLRPLMYRRTGALGSSRRTKMAAISDNSKHHLSMTQDWTARLLPRQVGIVPDDAAGRPVFSGISRFSRLFIPVLLQTHITSHTSALKTSLLRAAQISSLTSPQL